MTPVKVRMPDDEMVARIEADADAKRREAQEGAATFNVHELKFAGDAP